MKKNRFNLLCAVLALFATANVFVACSDDDFGPSIFDTTEYPLDRTQFTFPLDTFVKVNFEQPYNMKFKYRMEDIGSDLQKNLTPAEYDKSIQLATLAKYLWYDVYQMHAGTEFLKSYSPRIIHVIGSKNYNPSQGTETLGVAEGGLKITLYNVNNLDPADIDMMNEYFFLTMHHEFSHILDQTYQHPTAFNIISNGHYDAMGWSDTPDSISAGNGFVSSYASSAVGEDWVETIAHYITEDSISWSNRLEAAHNDWELIDTDITSQGQFNAVYRGCDLDTIGYFKLDESGNEENKIYRRAYERDQNDNIILDLNGRPIPRDLNGLDGREVIMKKLELCRTYLKTYYNVDIDDLRREVQKRTYLCTGNGEGFATTTVIDKNTKRERLSLVNRLLLTPEGNVPQAGEMTLMQTLVKQVEDYKSLQ